MPLGFGFRFCLIELFVL